MNFDKYVNKVPYTKETRKEYKAEELRLLEEFKKDLLDEFGLTNHPKADKFWEIVWDMGHAYGLSDVYSYADQLYVLLED